MSPDELDPNIRITAESARLDMDLSRRALVTWCLISLPAFAFGQNAATIKGTQTPSPTDIIAMMSPSSTSDPRPSGSDNAMSGNNNNGLNSKGLVNYYFVFVALVLCVVALSVFLVYRRRTRAVRRLRMSREQALERDLGRGGDGRWANWNPERRRYWQGRWRSAELSREEGLNEHGEAPPAYVPKRTSGEGQHDGEGHDGGPAVPLQTLSREDASLKPPDYTETYAQEVASRTRQSTASAASASSSRTPENRTSP